MATAPPASRDPDWNSLRQRVEYIYKKARTYIEAKGNERLKSLWPDWDRRIRELLQNSREQVEVAISLVGGVGAGKSTLLNSLIGARVLPVSNMRACTAAISEVGYSEGAYRARVEFISREAWQREVDLLSADLSDFRTDTEEDTAADPRPALTRAIRDKLWAVYKPAEDAPEPDWDKLQLVEPPEIKQALDAGAVVVQSEDLDKFRKEVAVYLDSKHRFRPIVKSVSVRGPFDALRDGAKLVDLPGINDPNEAREEVTRKHLKTCRFVWIIFNIKRALTKDTISLMQSDDFLRQIVMDGRSDALTFVGTAADDVDQETGIEEFGLHEDATMVEIVAARNHAVRKVVLSQLDDVAQRLAQLAREQRESGLKLAGRLKASSIFTVSAREYMRITRLAKTNSAGFTDVEQTEIPALQEHMRDLCAAYGVRAHAEALLGQLDTLLAEIQCEAQAQQSALKNRTELTERQGKEMRAATKAAQDFLDRQLGEARANLSGALEANQAQLTERIKRAVERARHELNQTVLRWERTHHSTIAAVCRRGGAYVGAGGRSDFPADLTKPILDGIAFAWSDFFSDKLRLALERGTLALVEHANDYRRHLLDSLASAGDMPQQMLENLDRVFATTEKVLREILEQTAKTVEGRIEEDQRTLYERVPQQVRDNMQAAFRQAAEQKGDGMKRRMVEILAGHARRVSDVMFDDARDAILAGVRGVNDWLGREYEKMTAAVRRNASLAAENLVAGGERLWGQEMERERQRVQELIAFAADLMGEGGK